MTREQIGTVEILEERVYPRFPATPPRELTTRDELVTVDAGKWPVYRDAQHDVIYWEMEGELIKIVPTFESLGGGMFMSRNKVRQLGQRVIFRSMTYTPAEFAEFRATHPLVVGSDSERRLVFEVAL